jgi:arabinofuranosyltransferase
MNRSRIAPGLVAVTSTWAVHAWLYSDFFIDDAFITLRHVQQWAAGNGVVYNIGDPVEGYSSFSWLVLLRAAGALGLDLIVAARVLGVGLTVSTLVLVHRFALGMPLPLVSPALLAISAPVAAWAVGGLETPLFMLLVFTGSWLFHREERQGVGWHSSVVWGLTALTRPEGVLFAGVALLVRARRLRRCRRWPAPHDYVRIAAFAAIVVPFVIWRLLYYGHPLPNTAYAKSPGLSLRPLLEGAHYLHVSATLLGGLPFLVLLVLLAWRGRERHPHIPYFTLNVAAYCSFVFLAGGDWMPAQRFLAHVLPLVAVIIHAGIAELLRWLSSAVSPKLVWLPVVAYTGLLAAGAVEVRLLEPGVPEDHRLSRPYPWIAYVQQRIAEGDTIAVLDAGRVGYELPLGVRIVDMVGLTDAHIAHLDPQLPSGLLGRGDAWGRWDIDYVLGLNPTFVQMHVHGRDETGEWRTGFTGTTLLANAPEFRDRYRPTDAAGIFERVRRGTGSRRTRGAFRDG